MTQAQKPHSTSAPDAFQVEWLRLEFNRMIDGDDERLRVTGSKGRQVLDGLVEQLEAARTALELVGAIQRTRLGWYRDQGVVFKSKLNGDPDPDDWESIAFWTYTDLCEVESIARATLEESNPASSPTKTDSPYIPRPSSPASEPDAPAGYRNKASVGLPEKAPVPDAPAPNQDTRDS